jgi:hypothetical protein
MSVLFAIPAVGAMVSDGARLFAMAAVDGLWQGMVLAAGVGLVLRVIPRTTARLRFVVWMAVLALAAGLPWVHFVATGGGAAGSGATRGAVQLGMGWSLGIAGVWLAIAAVRLGRLAVQGVRLRAVWREAKPVAVSSEVARLLESVPLRRVELCASESAMVDRPSVIGFFAPRILIPTWLLEQLTGANAGQELVQIVLHEVEHLRRGDDWLNLLQKVSLAVFPLNPALVWIERRLCSERELACDDGVLRVTGAPRQYATCLTALAERSLERRESERRGAVALALGALGRPSELSRRVYRILHRQPALRPVWAGALCVALTAGLGLGAVELARSPELVSFAGPVQPMDLARSLPEMPLRQPGLNAGRGASYGGRYQDVVFRDGKFQGGTAAVPVVMRDRQPLVKRAGAHRGLLQVSSPISMAKAAAPEVGVAQVSARPVEVDTVAKMDAAPMDRTPQMGAQAKETGSARRAAKVEGQWVVITSFNAGAERPQMFVRLSTRGDGQAVYTQYAAVPTELGWLIVEL